jgi:hypothetical protein
MTQGQTQVTKDKTTQWDQDLFNCGLVQANFMCSYEL